MKVNKGGMGDGGDSFSSKVRGSRRGDGFSLGDAFLAPVAVAVILTDEDAFNFAVKKLNLKIMLNPPGIKCALIFCHKKFG